MGGAPHLVARNVKIPVINAGDGFNEHPTQGLLDVFSMVDAKGDIAGKHVAIVGDIAHSRVARSNIWALTKLGAKVTVVAPPTLIPKGVEAMGVNVSYDLDEIIPQVDFINVLRMQLERQKGNLFPSQREYFKLFGITSKRLEKAKADMLVLHPGPINRGVEIASDVVDGSRNLILQQVTNGVAVRMAVLVALLSGQRNKNL
jgi:aspartate carbamoyltransferase catalytic subunit